VKITKVVGGRVRGGGGLLSRYGGTGVGSGFYGNAPYWGENIFERNVGTCPFVGGRAVSWGGTRGEKYRPNDIYYRARRDVGACVAV